MMGPPLMGFLFGCPCASSAQRAEQQRQENTPNYCRPRAVSVNAGVSLVGVLIIRALLIGVYIETPDFWKLPHGTARESRVVSEFSDTQSWIRYLHRTADNQKKLIAAHQKGT